MLHQVRDAVCPAIAKSHSTALMAASVGSALLYGVTATSLAFLSKVVLDVFGFSYPLTLMTSQIALTLLTVTLLNWCQCIELPALSRANVIQFLAPSFFNTVNGVLSMFALEEMNFTMNSMVKRNGPLVTMVLSALFLDKSFPNKYIALGVLMMSVGCVIAASGDITFHLEAYAFSAGSVISKSLHLILLQRLADNFSTPDILYISSVLSFPVLAVLAAATGEFGRVLHYDGYTNVLFIISLCSQIIFGSFLSFTLYLCNSNNSALTTSVVGTMKSVVQITVGMFTFEGVQFNSALISGVAMNLSGGIVYTCAKYLHREKNGNFQKIPSETSLNSLESGEAVSDYNQNTLKEDTQQQVLLLPPHESSCKSDERIL